MSNLTADILKEYRDCNKRVEEIKRGIFAKAKEVFTWENDNIGTNHELTETSGWCCKNISISEDGYVYIDAYEIWSYGGYDEDDFMIEQYKLFSDDWREKALEEYNLRMEQSLKDKTEKEKQELLEIERKEREELARLKAKYEK